MASVGKSAKLEYAASDSKNNLQARQDRARKEDSLVKAKKIAEILGLLGESHRGKNWLLKELRIHHLKIPRESTLNSYEILRCCPPEFVSNLHQALQGGNVKGFEDVQSLAKTYFWLFTDIVGGSNPTIPTRDQIRRIVALTELIRRTETFRNKDAASTVILPVGDGVAVGFSDNPEKPLRLAIELHKSLFRYNEQKTEKDRLIIRIGIDMGPVYTVKDLNGKNNVWGPGIILARRVMDLCGEMNIFASAIAEGIRKLSPEYAKILHPIGNYSIKHDEELIIYNIYGQGFGNKVAPRKAKILAPNLERDIRTVNNFSYNDFKVGLEILDQETWLTRHTWFMDVINVSKKPMNQIFFSLDGDSPKEFGDLNVSIKDEHDNTLEILAVNVNRPYHKQFNAQLNRPLKPKQRKIVILEYDWEEPKRTYFYRFASGCRHFTYSLTVPREVELDIRILKVDTETGSKVDASPVPELFNDNDKTVVRWSKDDLMIEDAYEFNW